MIRRIPSDVVRVVRFASLVSLVWLAACSSGSVRDNPTPPSAPVINGLTENANVPIGHAQVWPFSVTNNPTSVTCNVQGPGVCQVASDWASVSYTGAAPSSGDWKATLSLIAGNAGGQTTAKVSITLYHVTGVVVTPAAAVITQLQNPPLKLTAKVQYDGICNNETVNLTVPEGMGAIASDGTYTPPSVHGFIKVPVTAVSNADQSVVGSATITVGFAWVQYYAPEGFNDTATALALSLDETQLLVADYRTTPGGSDSGISPHDTIVGTAGLLLFDAQTGELKDSSWIGPAPSKILSMTTAPDGTIYAVGFTGNGSVRQAVVWKIA